MTMTTERRNFLKGVSAAAASTAVLAGTQALAQSNQQTGAKAMTYQAKPMPFDPKSITGISEKVLVSHYDNNYVGAVKRLNAIGAQLAELDFAKAPNFAINGLKREELGSGLIKSTIQELRRDRQRPSNSEPTCRSGLRCV